MSAQVGFALRGRNPDVLTCIANLSNDEVFTPPEFANGMLDMLAEAWAADRGGANLWADKTVKFLDPFTKSGVFLRVITSRLTEGLVDEMPNLEERVNHILTKQVFGIGITHLTSLLARRSVYCSKHANGNHSVAKSFNTESGNTGSSARSTHGQMASASIAGQARIRSHAAKGLKPPLTRSFTPTRSRVGLPSCLEATCSSM
jgi:site-specific DNA-methyltransferase (adenine-specific)